MVTVFNKEYESYDAAAKSMLDIGKNSLYRFWERENLPKMTITEMIEYCVNNGIVKDQIRAKRKVHYVKSFEDAMIEQYGIKDYKRMFLPEENSINPKEVGFKSHIKINVHCLCKRPHYIPDIEICQVYSIEPGKCPYTSHTSRNKYILKEDTLGYVYPYSLQIWSKNNEMTPFDVYPTATGTYWWKCENGFHEDYPRRLTSQVSIFKQKKEYICPECQNTFGFKYESLVGKKYGDLTVIELDKEETVKHRLEAKSRSVRTCKMWKCRCSCGNLVTKDANSLKAGSVKNCGEKKEHYGGEKNPNWRGGLTTEHETIRKSKEYDQWRMNVYRKDDFTCQACGRRKTGDNIELHAHHIISFSYLLECDRSHLFDTNIGITMCSDCHFSSNPRSLHNIYGTDDVSPEQLEAFVNDKRKEVGISDSFSVRGYMNGAHYLPRRERRQRKSKVDPNSLTSKSKRYGITVSTYKARKGKGWSEEEAWNTPGKCNKKECKDHLGNRYSSIAVMCREWAVSRHVFEYRIKKGWGLREALETPVKAMDTSVKDHTGRRFKSTTEMCNYYHVNPATYKQRYNKLGWTQEEALIGNRKKQKRVKDYNGELYYTEREMSEKHGVPYSTYLKRKAKGLSLREALTPTHTI